MTSNTESEIVTIAAPKLAVVARCFQAHLDYAGSYVRGVVVMSDGRFFAGTEELDTPDSLVAYTVMYDSSQAHPSIQAALAAAATLAVAEASYKPLERPLRPECDITQTIQSVRSSAWRFINECDETKAHVGELHEPDQSIQFFAGIQCSHRGGDSEISWTGPLASFEAAERAAESLVAEAEASAISYTEPRWSASEPQA